ncbi:tyrosine-type recombinase/integrase [Aliarcobacter butzleri]|uniref:tyrosine-type recombinase/integrase n=1 Tax=Aliarcobacter butzleri TaxID=28197 RepID=UPI001EDADD68|nr:tyrosine-type recombinase/integrase [Aliarcobacter butzleri]MCG3683870.1 tyrosine-type recombinase/integrase [Aliarcobacter butzleri]
MIINIGNDFTIAVLYNEEMIELYKGKEWSHWMQNLQNLSSNTVKSFMKSMERFWIWSLYHNTHDNEALPYYLARYREDLKSGFEIKEEVKIANKEILLTKYISRPMIKNTINKEFAGIKSYFFYIEDNDLMQDSSSINKAYEKRKAQYSFLSSINMKKADINYKLTAKKREFLKPYKTRVRSSKNIKNFPNELFDILLDIANPRQKLLYLLCGACSARIGQALNLTIYDLDYEEKEVWLLDPKGDDKDIYGNKRKQWLKEEYSIDASYTLPHNAPDLQFKYPIPYEYEPLFWINPKYTEIFFSTLVEYVNSNRYLPEASRIPRHPFLFVTKSGNRLRTREVNNRLKKDLKKLKKMMNISSDIEKFSLHSLRHLFGFNCAYLYGKTGNESLILWTKNAMGHSSLESTMIYFKMSYEMKKELLKKSLKSLTKEDKNETR